MRTILLTLMFGLSFGACVATEGATSLRVRTEDTVPPPADEPKKCPSGNNGDCLNNGDAKWCTHCRDGKKIETDEYFCANEADHKEHEKGCTGED